MANEFKSGFVTVVGLPNVGKSTLINRCVGQKVAIISQKPQTTRQKILGIRTTDKTQIIFVDTPGIHTPRTKLGEYMVNSANESVRDADIAVFVTAAGRDVTDKEREIVENIKAEGIPAILVINKVDAVAKDTIPEKIVVFNEMMDFAATVPLSAKTGSGVKFLLAEIEKLLPEGPEFYDGDTVTDVNERVMASEIIREKMLNLLDKEIPHGTAVEIIDFKEEPGIVNIQATIYCEKDSHKGIIIGKKGEMLKRIGAKARVDIEEMVEKKVFLELWVKVKDDWRNNNYLMKSFGYDSQE